MNNFLDFGTYEEYNPLEGDPNLNENIIMKRIIWNSELFTIAEIYDRNLMKSCALFYPKAEALVDNKEELHALFMSYIPMTQHRNFLQLYYPTRIRGNKVAFVCENPGDNLATLRGKYEEQWINFYFV